MMSLFFPMDLKILTEITTDMKVGCDIVDLRRLNLENMAFIKGILSKRERDLFNARDDKRSFLGGRFAAKEAFLKALGLGVLSVRLSEIEVLYRDNGQPFLLFQENEYEVSISHDGGYAMAVVVL